MCSYPEPTQYQEWDGVTRAMVSMDKELNSSQYDLQRKALVNVACFSGAMSGQYRLHRAYSDVLVALSWYFIGLSSPAVLSLGRPCLFAHDRIDIDLHDPIIRLLLFLRSEVLAAGVKDVASGLTGFDCHFAVSHIGLKRICNLHVAHLTPMYLRAGVSYAWIRIPRYISGPERHGRFHPVRWKSGQIPVFPFRLSHRPRRWPAADHFGAWRQRKLYDLPA